MTLTEKIFARASEKPQLSPGDNVWVNVDTLMTHDISGPGSIGIFKREFGPDAKVESPPLLFLQVPLGCLLSFFLSFLFFFFLLTEGT